jgi:hypothetical protein
MRWERLVRVRGRASVAASLAVLCCGLLVSAHSISYDVIRCGVLEDLHVMRKVHRIAPSASHGSSGLIRSTSRPLS